MSMYRQRLSKLQQDLFPSPTSPRVVTARSLLMEKMTATKRNQEASGNYPCNRCKGYGWIPGYLHVEAGVCFRCNGQGWKS